MLACPKPGLTEGALRPMSTQAQLTPFIIVIVIGAGALHACWNAIAKQVSDQLMAFAWIGLSSAAIGGVALAFTGLPYRTAIPYAIASGVIHIAYNLGLMNSYRLGSFNQTYPIARGISPLVVAVGAYFLAGEHLGAAALIGIVILAAGLMSLAFSSGKLTRKDTPAVCAAVFTGLTIASYTIVDGLGVRHSHDPLSYAALLFILQGPPMAIVAGFRRSASQWRDTSAIRLGSLAGAISVLAYGIVLWAQSRAPLAEVAAIRETSVVFAALIGLFVLDEEFGRRRIAAAVVIATGIILIGL
jgi:drug/metabolite transporter (DMT)-like permease